MKRLGDSDCLLVEKNALLRWLQVMRREGLGRDGGREGLLSDRPWNLALTGKLRDSGEYLICIP